MFYFILMTRHFQSCYIQIQLMLIDICVSFNLTLLDRESIAVGRCVVAIVHRYWVTQYQIVPKALLNALS